MFVEVSCQIFLYARVQTAKYIQWCIKLPKEQKISLVTVELRRIGFQIEMCRI